jgi:ribonuclease HII
MSSRKVIGVDEVGRGCLAGPVVCAAVILPDVPYPWVAEIRDSKKLTAKKRQELAALITQHSLYAIREGSVEQIDTDNILRTTLLTMRECVNAVFAQGGKADLVLVDGNQTIPGLGLAQEAIEGGDDIHKAIGAASIIAKVYRDNYMQGMDTFYPEYGFAKHKGYGTEQHRQAIMVHGPCKIHRLTFKGVYEYANQQE